MKSTNTEHSTVCKPSVSEVDNQSEAVEASDTDLARLAQLYEHLLGDDALVAPSLTHHIALARSKRRTSAQYRRCVEDGLFQWLTLEFNIKPRKDDRFDEDLLSDRELIDECEAIDIAIWIVGASDRRVREPILKRLHVAANKLSISERSDFLKRAIGRLSRLIRVSPTKETVALNSMLALLAWQGDDQIMAQAAIAVGRTQDPDNVLLQLVAGAIWAGLPQSAWAAVMDEYTLTQLRSG